MPEAPPFADATGPALAPDASAVGGASVVGDVFAVGEQAVPAGDESPVGDTAIPAVPGSDPVPGPVHPHNWHAAATMVVAILVTVVVVGAALHRNEPSASSSAGSVGAAAVTPASNGAPSGGAGDPSAAAPGSPATTALAAWQQQFLACVRQTESRNEYNAVSPSGSAFGAYQMTQTTWNNTVAQYGYTWLAGIQPNFATPADQDKVAGSLLEWQGTSPWTDGC